MPDLKTASIWLSAAIAGVALALIEALRGGATVDVATSAVAGVIAVAGCLTLYRASARAADDEHRTGRKVRSRARIGATAYDWVVVGLGALGIPLAIAGVISIWPALFGAVLVLFGARRLLAVRAAAAK